MDCFLDFCLACDSQTTDGLYCSQACRLADLERAGSSPHSPDAPLAYFSSTAWNSAHFAASSDVQEPSSSDRYSRRPSSSPSDTYHEARSPSRTRRRTTSHPSTPFNVLSPSSSRSSLTSGTSHSHDQSSDGLSEQAKNELRSYFDSFDKTREQRRQSYPVIRQASQ